MTICSLCNSQRRKLVICSYLLCSQGCHNQPCIVASSTRLSCFRTFSDSCPELQNWGQYKLIFGRIAVLGTPEGIHKCPNLQSSWVNGSKNWKYERQIMPYYGIFTISTNSECRGIKSTPRPLSPNSFLYCYCFKWGYQFI